MAFSIDHRKRNLNKLEAEIFDLVIIGGGICGAGVAREASSRGLKVALIEANDFASGTSSRSSKLIHGGIRYLENLEFGLVFEALSERRILFQMAPHLVHPLRFMLPVYSDSRVGMFKLGLGMWLYDALSLFEAPKLHERHNQHETLSEMPILNPHELVGSYVYSDAYMDDDRLVIETLRSAARFGAVSANYVRATSAQLAGGQMKALIARDEVTGKEIKISGRHFVSTVGPWTDIVAHELLGQWKKMMRPSKGVHLTFSRERLPLKDAVVMVSNDQKRIVFAIPRHEMVIVGTTDTDFKGDPELVHTTREDVDYLLNVTNEYFPGATIKEADILASYSGVRPLVDDGAETESKTSREHFIFTDSRNVTFVMGGKYTTYRLIAEQAVEKALESFSIEDRVRFRKEMSHSLEPLNELASVEALAIAKRSAGPWSRVYGVDVDTVNKLIDRHGLEAQSILEKFSRRTQNLWQLEAYHAIHETMCFHLIDFYLRRVPLFLAREDHGFHLLEDIAEIFAAELSWSPTQTQNQISTLKAHLNHEMRWRITSK
jgi:glycerol-3-phosphate dehydrogenase